MEPTLFSGEALHLDFWTYFTTPYFWSGFMGWCVAQVIKMTRGAIRTKSLDFTYLMSTGGMPSAHSSLVVGVFVSLGLGLGWTHPITVVSSVVATITMFDAATVRRAAGLLTQASSGKSNNRQIRAKYSRVGDAQRGGGRHGVVQGGLHDQTRNRQSRSGNDRRQHPGNPNIPDNADMGSAARFAQRRNALTDRHIGGTHKQADNA